MLEPGKPDDEAVRLKTLQSLKLLDTAPEERFDRLTRLARRLFDVPIALVSLVDTNRQWFKSRSGMNISETPRAISFCLSNSARRRASSSGLICATLL